MNQKNAKNFFLIAGVLTIMGSLPVMLAPRFATELLFDFTADIAQKYLPIIRHWAVMAVGLGGLLIAAATNSRLRFSAALFSTASKLYVIGCSIWYLNSDLNTFSQVRFGVHANYTILIALETILVLGGILYLSKPTEEAITA